MRIKIKYGSQFCRIIIVILKGIGTALTLDCEWPLYDRLHNTIRDNNYNISAFFKGL